MLQEAGQSKQARPLALHTRSTFRGAMTRFRKDMSIFEALAAHPGARQVFEKHGMTCCLCIGAQSESVEAGAILHQVDPDVVVDELNRLGDSAGA
jgi:hybrid cluster-associated redox disulfide protein